MKATEQTTERPGDIIRVNHARRSRKQDGRQNISIAYYYTSIYWRVTPD
jgi:hypothetical protein